ncbi:MAG TPA: phosphate ABC transporter permease subunit PstC [Solirubrobacteraceae bacterium]
MSTANPPAPSPRGGFATAVRRNTVDRIGDPTLRVLATLASAVAIAVILLIAYKVLAGSDTAFSKFGLRFLTTKVWNPVTNQFGAGSFIYGTIVSSAFAMLFAAPLSIAIALYLTELAPRRIRRPVATLVDLLAAIPSVIIGLWGILVMAPFMENHLEPALHSVLGWIPLFGGSPSPYGLLPAIAVLTIMAVPIISAITREVFETVPGDLKEAAYALGATRWEMTRMVILPIARPGIVGASILGLGRALGEAIAVTQVIGGAVAINASLFQPSDTLASRIASQFQSASGTVYISSLFYLAAILLVISLIVNIGARLIVRRGIAA